MHKIIKCFFIVTMCLCNSIFSAEEIHFYFLKNAEIEDLQRSNLETYVWEFYGKGERLEDYILIEGTLDSSVSQKNALVSLKKDQIYLWAEPGLVNIEAWDPIISCLLRHLEAVDEITKSKYCSKNIRLDSSLKHRLNQLVKDEYLSFTGNYSVSFVKDKKVYTVKISKSEEEAFFSFYNELYKLIKETVDFSFENCHWTKLIKNVNGFLKKTNNPESMTDVGLMCPEIL